MFLLSRETKISWPYIDRKGIRPDKKYIDKVVQLKEPCSEEIERFLYGSVAR